MKFSLLGGVSVFNFTPTGWYGLSRKPHYVIRLNDSEVAETVGFGSARTLEWNAGVLVSGPCRPRVTEPLIYGAFSTIDNLVFNGGRTRSATEWGVAPLNIK